MREAGTPSVAGQSLVVEDREGDRWSVDCLGEPVEAGARITFEAVGSISARHGEHVRVLDSARSDFVCRLHVDGRGARGRLRLVPFGGVETPLLELARNDLGDARDGDRVLVTPVGSSKSRGGDRSGAGRAPRPASRRRLRVRMVEVLGQAGEPAADHAAIVWKHRLPTDFSRRARLEAEAIASEEGSEAIDGRRDLRHLPFVTIDPASARDHDDAVFAEQRRASPALRVESRDAPPARSSVRGGGRETGWSRTLWVAIADVSHYVREGSFLDAEARRRGNSFYLPGRSIPMLPDVLSSDLCSLRAGVDRLALVVELRIDAGGVVLDAVFHEAVIRSRAGLAYEAVADWLETSQGADPKEPETDPEWAASLRCLDEIATGLARERERAGSLALELPEIEVIVDREGRPVDARSRPRNRAHVLIEEAMLAANRAVARALDRADRPAIHRVHPPPPPHRLDALGERFERAGIELTGELDEPGVLAAALEAARGTASEERLHMAALRAMSQAHYAAESGGHYALRFEHYVHFTSPIRRYADLEVHRSMRRAIRGESSPRRAGAQHAGESKPADSAEGLAIWLSGRERLAVDAERDADALACCALMAGREDERFRGRVVAATEFGLFIRLEAPGVEGLVPIRSLEGHWEVVDDGEALVSQGLRKRIEVGAPIDVRLVAVDQDLARLAFEPIEPGERRGSSRRRADRPGGRRRGGAARKSAD